MLDEFDDFDDDFDDSFDFDDDLDFDDDFDENKSNDYSKEDIDLFDEKPLETDSNYDVTAFEVHISTQLTSRKIIELMDTYPSLRRITCPKSIYDRISPKYLDVLNDLGISVEIKYNWGKKKYSSDEISNVINLLNQGYSTQEVADDLDLPLKTVNYFKSKYHNQITVKNYNRKYDDETRSRIISMRENGIKAKEIAEKENIPLRSVYYILNKK